MQYLDFSALEHNALYFKCLLGHSKLCAVIKNDAYGHGIVHVARYLNNIVDCFAVGSVFEAKQIDFVDKDILILIPPCASDMKLAINSGYVLIVDSFETFKIVKNVCDELDKTVRIHIKIDSGMSRLGFGSKDICKLVCLLENSPRIIVEGVYSHFYGENALDCVKQFQEFMPCCRAIEQSLGKRLIKHISNSGGALLSNKYHLDMARIGLGLYGYGNENLRAVKTVTANVVAVKEIGAGSVVGYGAKFVAAANCKIAVVDVGYAQGFARALVGTSVEVNGIKCKVLAVCMAMIIVEVDNVDVNVSDSVKLLGAGINISNDTVSIYELLCNLH